MASSAADIFRRRPLPGPLRSSIGFFEGLPLEAFYMILSHLPLESAGNLGLSSERLRVLVSDWSQSGSCLSRARAELLPFSVLCKRVTSLLATKERIRFMTSRFHSCLLKRGTKEGRTWSIDHHHFCDYFSHFGSMLYRFVKGWDESEYSLLFSALDKMFSISARISKYMNFLTKPPLSFFCPSSGRVNKEIHHTERQLRLILRSLWWDLSENDHGARGDWLLANMNHFLGPSPIKQALALFLMTGPTLGRIERSVIEDDEETSEVNDYYTNIDWSFMSTHTPMDFEEGKHIFNRLAQCISHLSHDSPTWRKTLMINVLDSLFRLPVGWMRDNVSGFLLFCNERVLLDYLYMKIDSATGTDSNLLVPGRLLVDIMMESYKLDNAIIHGHGVGIVVDKVLRYVNPAIRIEFFDTLWDVLLSEIEESGDSIPIDEVIIGFGRFISKRSIYTAGKKRRKEADVDDGPKIKKNRQESSEDEDNGPSNNEE